MNNPNNEKDFLKKTFEILEESNRFGLITEYQKNILISEISLSLKENRITQELKDNLYYLISHLTDNILTRERDFKENKRIYSGLLEVGYNISNLLGDDLLRDSFVKTNNIIETYDSFFVVLMRLESITNKLSSIIPNQSPSIEYSQLFSKVFSSNKNEGCV